MTFLRRTAVATACLLASALPCRAQIYETVGTRAQGMAGAFVAVADDATAVWWNPGRSGDRGAISAWCWSMVK